MRVTSEPGNPAEIPLDEPHSVRLDRRVNLGNWRHRLSAAEIDRIRELTEPVGSRWYPGASWD